MPKTDRQLGFQDERPEDLQAYLARIDAHRHPLSLLLAGVEDVRNIGALFRLADAARLAQLYYYGDEALLQQRKLQRVARSTLDYVPHSCLSLPALTALSAERPLVGLEITSQSQPYTEHRFVPGTILALGHEAHGLPSEVLALCSGCIHLPMYGVNTSMNVAMAAGIAVYHALDKFSA